MTGNDLRLERTSRGFTDEPVAEIVQCSQAVSGFEQLAWGSSLSARVQPEEPAP
jgi:hypothetical protein